MFNERFYLHHRKHLHTIVSISYYHGVFLREPKQICCGFKCYLQKFTVKSLCTSSYHLKVDYPAYALQPLHINTEAVTHPTGQDMGFSSFQTCSHHYFNSISESFSWLSSIIFHINCSKYVQDTINWSGLSPNLTKQICVDKNFQTSGMNIWKSIQPNNNESFYIMQPPVKGTILSNLWTLKISFLGTIIFTKSISNYGNLVFSSNPL